MRCNFFFRAFIRLGGSEVATNAVTPDGVTNTVLSLKAPIQTANATEKVTLTITGSTATQGVVYVWLDLLQMQ